jgi:hypothetical protein
MADAPPRNISYLWKAWGEIAAREGWCICLRLAFETLTLLQGNLYPRPLADL